MKTPLVIPATKQERDAAFAQIFANIAPAVVKGPTVAEVLKAYREQILQKRKEGYSLRQICAAMRQPPVNAKVSYRTLTEVIGERAKKRSRRTNSLPVLTPVVPLGPS